MWPPLIGSQKEGWETKKEGRKEKGRRVERRKEKGESFQTQKTDLLKLYKNLKTEIHQPVFKPQHPK